MLVFAFFLTFLLSICAGCSTEQPSEPTEEVIPKAKIDPHKPMVISLSQDSYGPDDQMGIVISNPSKREQKFSSLMLERQTNDGEWELIRGRLFCPCLTDCPRREISILPESTHTIEFDNFYEIRGESLPHTVFCGLMKPNTFRIRILNHPDVKPVEFSWQ